MQPGPGPPLPLIEGPPAAYIEACQAFRQQVAVVARGVAWSPLEPCTWPDDWSALLLQHPADADAFAAGHGIDVAFPATVRLGLANGGICSGTLVAPATVLTAAHCAGVAEVLVGRSGHPDDLVSTHAVARQVRHPWLDASLVFLDTAPAVEPAVFRVTLDRHAPTALVLAGFGYQDRDARVGVGVVTYAAFGPDAIAWVCGLWDAARTGCIPGRDAVVVDGAHGWDSCSGDSGGPLYEPWASGWRVAAIVSRGVWATHHTCGGGGVYLRLDAIADWLLTTVREHHALILRALRRPP